MMDVLVEITDSAQQVAEQPYHDQEWTIFNWHGLEIINSKYELLISHYQSHKQQRASNKYLSSSRNISLNLRR